jgi:hypothetical protein
VRGSSFLNHYWPSRVRSKTLTLVRYGKGYPDETQAKVKALLPSVDVKFVK